MCTRIRKGIINPNYPGFQSLAYTLNEDNFDYSSENPSDDDEDSYVSESDDNEMKQREKEPEQPGDENGNSYGGDNSQVDEQNLHLHSSMDIPIVRSSLYHAPPMTTALETEEFFPSNSPYHRTRMQLIPTGRKSPTLTTSMFDTEEQLESTVIYACTPPDIVLQHSYDHRSSAHETCKEFAKLTLELSNSQKPDLIPEQQSVTARTERQLKKSYEVDTMAKLNDLQEHDHPATTLMDGFQKDMKHEDVDDTVQDDNEGNRSPPSPAIELVQAVGSNFQQETSLPPDTVLDEIIECFGPPSDGALSEDSEQESDEGELEYKPYGVEESGVDSYPSSPSDVPASGDSGDSAGSSPGEVQYHLVDDCSNQTVQITRSRQSNEQSPTNHYHLLHHYSTPGPMDYHNNPTQPANVMEHGIIRNDYYSSLGQSAAQPNPSEFGHQNVTRFTRVANRDETEASFDFPEARPSTLQLTRREANFSSYSAHVASDIQTSSCKEKNKKHDDNQTHSTEIVVPEKQFQKVPKVNPFCEALLQESDTCDFFTKQAKLQIEARMALCQAKDMAHMQMEFEKRSLPLSPVTRVIHTAVEKAGLSLAQDKRRLSRYYLTRLNVHQLQTILTELQGHAEVLNEELVELLMERDELHISQDATLIDIEDLSRYLCAKEQTIIHAERQRKNHYWNSNRAMHHHQSHQKQPSLPQPPPPPPIRSTCGTAIPAYRYH
ncbi:schwannomin-interacting protein 1-like [Anopheles stephensi]|uniref:schwannomin-interacting protein 1-like n=1 Tax=Anopheles stephensi TaxID=30069 RepID=UPI0016588C7C|nr:schwannomin-interacting protein 1-like [Anopheles stephensi]XP_035894551.1 schwannomin-interacting protein 1-like [Anopheles stephensi]